MQKGELSTDGIVKYLLGKGKFFVVVLASACSLIHRIFRDSSLCSDNPSSIDNRLILYAVRASTTES
jgi:hypothetical protein